MPLFVGASESYDTDAWEAYNLKAENAKLREERDMYRDLVGMMDHPDLNAQLQADNANLRELCGELLDNLMPEICAKAHWCRDKDWHACDDDACGNYAFVILARDLGVEL